MKTTKLLAISMALCLGATSAFGQTNYDNCVDAFELTPGTLKDACTIGNNTGATLETGETSSCAFTCAEVPAPGIDATIWYKFEVTTAGSYTITTDVSGDSPDTQIELYSALNMDCDSLTSVACNDDGGTCNALAAEIIAPLLSLGWYYVQVDIYCEVEGEFAIQVIDNNITASPSNDTWNGTPVNIDYVQDNLDPAGGTFFGASDVYSYCNVTSETIKLDNGVDNENYSSCNNDPDEQTLFYGVWFEFTYNDTQPDAVVSVIPTDFEKCDNGESSSIFYTMHLFNGKPSGSSNSVVFDDLTAWCSVGDSPNNEEANDRGNRDYAINSFVDHPRLSLSNLKNGKYYLLVAQMTRVTVNITTREDTVGFDPITGTPIVVFVTDTANTNPSPSNGQFKLCYEAAPNGTTSADGVSEDKCPGAAINANDSICYTNAGMTGNITISPAPAPTDEPAGYTGCNDGRGYYENCNPDSLLLTGSCLSWENQNSAIYSFEIADPTAIDTFICVTKAELKEQVIELIDILCPTLTLLPGNFPPIFDPSTGDTLIALGDTLADRYGNGNGIDIPSQAFCDSVKALVCDIFDLITQDELCFSINCTPKTDVYLTVKDCKGDGASKITVLDNCEAGDVVMWSNVDCAESCVTLSSGLTPLAPGTYYVAIEGDGNILSYNLWVKNTYSYGLGGAPCSPDPFPSVASTIAEQGKAIHSMRLQPVPANDQLTVKFNTANDANQVNIHVFDLTGKEAISSRSVSVSQGENTYQLDVSSLNNGMYLLSIDNNGERVVSRFSVAK
jgi:hypothetical protein